MRDIFNSYTLTELRKIASGYNKNVKIAGIHKKNKTELINELMKHTQHFKSLKMKDKKPKRPLKEVKPKITPIKKATPKPKAPPKPTPKPKATPKKSTEPKPSKVKEDFPHLGFPYRLEYMEGADKRICFFQCENHMEKHLVRHKLNRKTCKISVRED